MLVITFTLGTGSIVRAASTEKILYSFGFIFPDGSNPEGGLVFDNAGNLYGTTIGGGNGGYGTVYLLSPSVNGWTETILYSFCPNCAGGSSPIGSLVIDAGGNLYGTANSGGNSSLCGGGCGVVFELSPGTGGWTETVIYTFSGPDGARPIAGLALDVHGNLYGTTPYGGASNHCPSGLAPGCGVVFKLTKNSTGTWTETVLHSFQGGSDGDTPSARVTLDSLGNVYGTTAGSMSSDPGTVFKLVRTKTGKWNETVLYRFKGTTDGNSPEAGVVLGHSGAVYGTTRYGGSGTCSAFGYSGCGTVFELQDLNGTWNETVLYSFNGGTDGADPAAGVIFGANGDLYGTTAEGGAISTCGNNGCGTLFKLAPSTGGSWKETQLIRFNESAGDGAYPLGDLILDKVGNIYSTTQYGGTYNSGAVFEANP